MAGWRRAAALGVVLTVTGGLALGGGAATASGVPDPPMPVPSVSVDLAAEDVVWDRVHGLVYAVLGSTASTPDSLAVIDPDAGRVVRTVAAGPDPDRLELASDASRLYVGVAASGEIVEYAVPGLTAVRRWSLGNDPTFGPRQALDIEAVPGRPGSVAVVLGSDQSISVGIAVYDDGVARTDRIGNGSSIGDVTFGADESVLYATRTDALNGGQLVRLGVDAAGVRIDGTGPVQVTGPVTFAGGRVYVDGRWALDPTLPTPRLLGAFEWPLFYLPQGFTIDEDAGRAWTVLATPSTFAARLVAFDLTTFQQVDEFTLPLTGTTDRTWWQLVDGPGSRLVLRGTGRVAVLDPGRLRGASGEFTAPSPTVRPAAHSSRATPGSLPRVPSPWRSRSPRSSRRRPGS